MRCQFVIVALFLSACAAPPTQITGRYAAGLSDADVEQIKLVVAARRDLGRTLKELEVVGRDRVRVEVGRYHGPRSWTGASFFVVRYGDTWRIDEHSPFSATVQRTITVY